MTAIPDRKAVADQLQRNREAYDKVREAVEAEHSGRFALMHGGEIIEIYNDSGDAYSIGCEKFGLGNFSIEKIGDTPISLGILAMCASSRI